MLEKLLKFLKPKEKPIVTSRCIWKSIHAYNLPHKVQLDSLEKNYGMNLEKCQNCDGYKIHETCYYIHK